jgi:molybdopterin biosynthesis enzyme
MEMFRKLLTLDEALQIICQHFPPKPIGAEEIPLLEAYDRVLAEDVTATLEIPPFDRSTVDGYAVKAEDTFEGDENKPVKLKVCGTVNLGELPKLTIKRGEAAEIVTGAPMPKGADATIMLEYTERRGDDLYVYGRPEKEKGITSKGDRRLSCDRLSKSQSLYCSTGSGSFYRSRDNRTREKAFAWKGL